MPNPLELSSLEVTTFNHVSQAVNPAISLGAKLNAAFANILLQRASDSTHDSMVDGLIADLIARIALGTPVNAVSSKATLTLTGVVLDGETISISNPITPGLDTYEFLADSAQTKTDPANIAVNIYAKTTKSSGTLTVVAQPDSGETLTIGSKTYTFVPVGTDTADGEISVGADLTAVQANIVAAINGTDDVNTPHPDVTIGAFAANVATITALVGGAAGDTIATTETFADVGNVFSAVTLGSGADCTAADAITALVAAVTASDTQGVSATDGDGDTVILAADVGGEGGDDIAVGTTLSNGAFAAGATTLSGGVNGTPAVAPAILIDATNLYVCLADNDATGVNWKKIPFQTL